MADFRSALDGALSRFYAVVDFRSPVGSRRGLTARLNAMERQHGTKKAAARAIGVSPDTYGRWRSGKAKPSAASLGKVATAHRALLRHAKIKAKGPFKKLEVTATVACYGGGPPKKKYYNGGVTDANTPLKPAMAYRTFKADKLTAHERGEIAGEWASGGAAAAEEAALVRIEAAYGSEFDFEGDNVKVDIG